MVDYLSEDLVIKILLRLPILCFIRFRCVCKSWSVLLCDPKFIYKKLLFDGEEDDRYSQQPVLVKRYDQKTRNFVFSFFSGSGKMSAIEEITYPKDIMRESTTDLPSLLIVGPCCNGLICLRDFFNLRSEYHYSDCNMILWNPLTSDYKIIPESDAWLRPESCDYISLDIVEFGIDRRSRDGKIFKYFTVDYPDHRERVVEIYSMNNDSWTKLDDDVVSVVDIWDRSGKCHITGANGEFHWWDTDLDNNSRNQIVSFDLSDEIFKTAPIPDALSMVYYKYHFVFTINDYVAALLSPNIGHFIEGMDMWVMFEYGVVQSWSKLFTVSFSSCVERPLGLLKNGEVFIATGCGELLLWNPSTEAISDILIDGVYDSVQIVTFNGAVNQV